MKRTMIIQLNSLLVAIALAGAAGIAWAADAERCLNCHGDPAKADVGRYIDPVKYGHTKHGSIGSASYGCRTCHDGVSDTHPNDGMAVLSTTSCKDCHSDVLKEYAKSAHFGYAECGSCHDPHSAHGPTEVSGHDMNRMCGTCHKSQKMATLHDRWLPQADLHLRELPCITCHSTSTNYVITMYFVKREKPGNPGAFKLASQAELQKVAHADDVRALLDKSNDNFISLEELRDFNRSAAYESLRLQAMMMPEKITHNFKVLENRWDCSFCHGGGPGIMQTSFVAFPDQSGTFTRVPVEKGAVLAAIYGNQDFYMVGVTRNPVMDILGGLIVVGGMVMPIGHGTLRLLTRKNRKGKGH